MLFRTDVSISNDTIYVTEADTTSDWANCYCNYDLYASVTRLQNGNYFVKVFRYIPLFYPDTVLYTDPKSLTYGDSGLIIISHSYQSDCYNITEVNKNKIYPTSFKLGQNYTHPFNPITTISWKLSVRNHQTLKVYEILRNEIATLVHEYKLPGSCEIEFSAV